MEEEICHQEPGSSNAQNDIAGVWWGCDGGIISPICETSLSMSKYRILFSENTHLKLDKAGIDLVHVLRMFGSDVCRTYQRSQLPC